MYLSSVVAHSILLTLSFASQAPINSDYSLASTIRDVLKSNQVISDVLNDFDPSYYLDIAYPEHQVVLLGNDIPVSAVQERPVFTFHPITTNTAKNSTFTLALTDPDAKSRSNPKWSEMCHWILTNITSISSPRLTKEAGELKGYKPPGPPPKTGPHRYVFVLLEGEATNLAPPEARQHWGYGEKRIGVQRWAKENGLEVVGANFFFAQAKQQ